MSFRWVESFGENESYIKCLVPDVSYSSLSEMIADFQANNGLIVDNVGDKEKTDLTSLDAPSGEHTLSNGSKYNNRVGTQWYMQLILKDETTNFATAGGYSPNGRFITIAVDDDVQKAVIFDSYPTSNTSTSVILRATYTTVTAEDKLMQAYQWINGAETPTSEVTTTAFKLWIKGLNAPTYKLNWHNEALENEGYDFSNSTIYIRAGKQYSDGIHHHSFKEVDYSDGSIKFTWYDIDEVAETNILFPWINLEVHATYVDDSGEEKDSSICTVDLRKKSMNFTGMYQNVANGEDGSIIEIINYDDDPSGFDDDDDDYHDPSDNEDDTPDDSTDISISGEVCKTFKIEQIELKKLSQFLWSSDFFDNVLLVNNSPIENIISLKALIGTVATTGTSQTLTLGNVTTTANAIPCNESITINVGSITLPRKYNNFLDFEPYTKVQIYLPFYGCAMLDSSLVIGRTITIKYIIDVITATAKIKIIHDNKTLYEFKTTCGSDLPITSSNRASVEMGYLSSGVGMGISIASGNVLGGLASALSMAQSQYHSSTSGNVSGVLNFHDSRMVTVLVDRPVYTELRNFNKTHGRVCNLSKTLRDLRGFTKCAENVQIPFNCLDEERTMIIEQLTNGVII